MVKRHLEQDSGGGETEAVERVAKRGRNNSGGVARGRGRGRGRAPSKLSKSGKRGSSGSKSGSGGGGKVPTRPGRGGRARGGPTRPPTRPGGRGPTRPGGVLDDSSNSSSDSEEDDSRVHPPRIESGSIVINTSGPTGERPVYVPKEIAAKLKPHQVEGVRFMWRNCVGAMDDVKAGFPGGGCILAHYMGLGKSLQVVTFLHAFFANQLGSHALLVVPVNTTHNWKNELTKWLGDENALTVFMLDDAGKTKQERAAFVQRWKSIGGVMVGGFEMVRNLCLAKNKKSNAALNALLRDLTDTPDLLVVDEGHRIKSDKTDIAKVLKRTKTKRRVVLTGSPLQNNLMEYYYMVDFVAEGVLKSAGWFRDRFEEPISKGQLAEATTREVRVSRQRTFVLSQMLKHLVHRRDYSCLKEGDMPEKYEYAVFVRLTPVQNELYERCVEQHKRSRSSGLFKAYHTMNRFWNHPDDLFYEGSAGSDSDFGGGSSGKGSGRRSSSSGNGGLFDRKDFGTGPNGLPLAWYDDILDKHGYTRGSIESSGKMIVALDIVRETLNNGEKLLIFSQSLAVLSNLEAVLPAVFETDKLGQVLRIDGSTSGAVRQNLIERFNSERSTSAVFLISTKAGCLGINLQAANRVILFDSSWNPVNDLQAIFRTYRFGQTKPVYVYRLVAHNTLENKIYERQIMKQGLSLSIVDDVEIDQIFSKGALDLYKREEDNGIDPPANVEVPSDLPVDPVMRALVARHYGPFAQLANRPGSDVGVQAYLANKGPPGAAEGGASDEDAGSGADAATKENGESGTPWYALSHWMTAETLLKERPVSLTAEDRVAAEAEYTRLTGSAAPSRGAKKGLNGSGASGVVDDDDVALVDIVMTTTAEVEGESGGTGRGSATKSKGKEPAGGSGAAVAHTNGNGVNEAGRHTTTATATTTTTTTTAAAAGAATTVAVDDDDDVIMFESPSPVSSSPSRTANGSTTSNGGVGTANNKTPPKKTSSTSPPTKVFVPESPPLATGGRAGGAGRSRRASGGRRKGLTSLTPPLAGRAKKLVGVSSSGSTGAGSGGAVGGSGAGAGTSGVPGVPGVNGVNGVSGECAIDLTGSENQRVNGNTPAPTTTAASSGMGEGTSGSGEPQLRSTDVLPGDSAEVVAVKQRRANRLAETARLLEREGHHAIRAIERRPVVRN